ncbi:MAG TPA: sigma-70 family RNA polymerase sigma factor [Chthoniobacterales bacterium]|jgi:RNA polymerase sigma-70 factor (ECF subfamily)|nr:sigma-70 family RNA polymerase sigma factor [Chthoniobacterales bacterium]
MAEEAATAQQVADHEMIVRIGRGDQGAFSALYDRLSGPLYSLAVKMLGDPAEAQDALQDVFVQIWARAGTYDSEQSSVFSWAVLLTRSRVIDRLRAQGRRLRVVAGSTEDEEHGGTAPASTIESAADTAEKSDEAVRVRSILNNLPPEQREAIEMAFFEHLTHHEIAARLGQPLGTVKARIRRGLLRLRQRLHT